MKVYIVIQYTCDGDNISAVFTNNKKAQELKNRLNDAEEDPDSHWHGVQEYELES